MRMPREESGGGESESDLCANVLEILVVQRGSNYIYQNPKSQH